LASAAFSALRRRAVFWSGGRLFQQVPECIIGEFLVILPAITRQQIGRMPSLIVELNTLAGHRGSLRSSQRGSRHWRLGNQAQWDGFPDPVGGA
jgi:hypothetical protein